jgi:hypothetical protein
MIDGGAMTTTVQGHMVATTVQASNGVTMNRPDGLAESLASAHPDLANPLRVG